ncbi:hypothetical protein MP638_005279 [Amoeboaphelidium occidentale]|nr:hypothetical protein MP638_005279 [Amoeboaphelidium occidentale]
MRRSSYLILAICLMISLSTGLPSNGESSASISSSGSQVILPELPSGSNRTSPLIILNVNSGNSTSGSNKSTDRWYYGDYDGYYSYYDSTIPIWGTRISSSYIGFYGIMLLCHISILILWLGDMIKFRRVRIPFRYFLTGVFLLRTVAQLTKLLLSIQNQENSSIIEKDTTLFQSLLLPSVYLDQGAVVALTLFVSRGWGTVKRLPNTIEIVSFSMWALAVCLISSSSYMYGGYRTRHNPFYLLIFAYLLLLVYKYMDALKQFFAVCPAKFTQWHVKPILLNPDGSTEPLLQQEEPFEGKVQFVDKLQKIFSVYLTVRVISELLVQSQLSLNLSIYFYELRELVFTAALLQVFLLSTATELWSRVYMLVPENSEAATEPQPYNEPPVSIATIPSPLSTNSTNIQSLRLRLQNLQRLAELSQYIQRNEEPLEATKYRFLKAPSNNNNNNNSSKDGSEAKNFEYKLLRFNNNKQQ